jgi:cell division protein FtsI (penicillin-binding protein 3)
MNRRQFTARAVVLSLCVLAAFGGLAARLVMLQVVPESEVQTKISRIRRIERPLEGGRGRIYDRRGNLLAVDVPVYHVCVNPSVLSTNDHLGFVATQLARVLDEDLDRIVYRMTRPDRECEYVQRYAPASVMERLQRMKLDGVFFQPARHRAYSHGRVLGHVLGFTNWEGLGSGGIEQAFDRKLRGKPGLLISQKDGLRREIYERRLKEVDPQPGADVYLTIDQNIQYMLEDALDQAMDEHGAQGAWGLVQLVHTGEILALANRPAFDPNRFRESAPGQMMNRAIGYSYEPGSTFKAAVLAAAIDQGIADPTELVDCENGVWMYNGRRLGDYHPHGTLSVADILKKSSNIGTAKIALRMEPSALEKALRAFGIGRPTGIELPGEEPGRLAPQAQWTSYSVPSIAMGHEVTVTALQMLNAINAIANDGRLMRPSIVARLVAPGGETVYRNTPEILSRPIRPRTARLMRMLMARVTDEGGTGQRARVEGYDVGGKTGTAQKVIDGRYADDANVASFVGFLPADKPEISVIVVVDDPQPLRTGGRVAAPLFSTVASQAIRYLEAGANPASRVAQQRNPQTDRKGS